MRHGHDNIQTFGCCLRCAAGVYEYAVQPPRTRRIWHAEAAAVSDALEAAGHWQAALRVRVAQRAALERRPEGSAFEYRPSPEDAGPLGEVLASLRARSRT
jgi:hypothetical protein